MRRRSGRWCTWKILALPVLLKVGECGNFRSDFQFVVGGCCVGIVAWGDTRIVFDFQNLLRKPPKRLVLDMIEFVLLLCRRLLLFDSLFRQCRYNKHHVSLMATQCYSQCSLFTLTHILCHVTVKRNLQSSLARKDPLLKQHFQNYKIIQNIWLILSLN